MQEFFRTAAVISLDAIAHNFRVARACLPQNTRLCAVVKADAYGHGARAIARFLAPQADCFAVALLEEGVALRKDGLRKQILILGYTYPEQAAATVEADLTPTVFTYESALALHQAAVAQKKTVKVHIATDTGMHRLGVPDDAAGIELVQRIAALPQLEIEGIFTHFARADEKDKSSAQAQYTRFVRFCARLPLNIPIRHICNSAAIGEFAPASPCDWKPPYLDMARLGIALYGLYPSEDVAKESLALRPAMTWEACIMHLKDVAAGRGVGYGHAFVTTRRTRIATIPVGYADGFPRALGNAGRVLIHACAVPIIGRICMDMCMADVTDIPNVTLGTRVTLVGTQGTESVTLEEIGALSASFNYETACRVSARVPRVYTYQGKTCVSPEEIAQAGHHALCLAQGTA
jgi:alanine racemase